MSWPKIFDESYKYRRPLKYQDGGEKSETLVLHASSVSVDDDLRRIVPAGTVLCEITSGHADGLVGPYCKTASDGRQSLTEGKVYVAVESHDATYGNQAIAGYFQDCVFNIDQVGDSEAAGDPISKHGDTFEALKDALPQCTFR